MKNKTKEKNMKKAFFLIGVSMLILTSFANAGRGRPGLGTLIGAGVGVVTGHVAEKEIQEALNKDTYSGDGFVLTEQGVVLKLDDGDVFLKVQNLKDTYILSDVIKTTNKIEVTRKAEWGNINGKVPVCVADTICSLILVDVKKDKYLSVKFAFKEDAAADDMCDLIGYESQEPGILDYVWNFVLNHIIFVAIVFFGLLGYVWDFLKKKKEKQTQPRDVTMSLNADDLDKDRRL